MLDTILMPIRKRFADEIFSGKKLYEYRKSIPKHPVKRVFVYEARGCKKVVGFFDVEEILLNYPDEIWEITGKFSGISPEEFFDYFKDREIAYAYKIALPVKFEIPRSISFYGISRPPQNYVWI